jgi:hydrogenase maturation protein HypF
MSEVATHGVEITVQGIVQGVGFRPFVYRLAKRWNLVGSILNSDQGVVIVIEGTAASIQSFLDTLYETPPPLAQISSIEQKNSTSLKAFTSFTIAKSVSTQKSRAIIPADIATCNDCLQDIADPENRRFQYPFTNCTNCGPRYSIVTKIPYDRPGTSMNSFPLCVACRTEYEDPENRRFHAQPNACPVCGPELSYYDKEGNKLTVDSTLQAVAEDLKNGKIVAMRGLGGFHLIVDAHSETAVQRLRKRKGRRSKPLAVMAANQAEAHLFCDINVRDAEILQGTQHPILLLPLHKNKLAPSLAPNISEIGVMLPYTPLHQLLFLEKDCPKTLVMTSGNRSGAPIFTANNAALDGLKSIADSFLLHNREIVTRVDDSVVRNSSRGIQILRRSRGYIPSATILPQTLPEILSCGAGLKSTFCLTREKEAFLSQHIGDLFNLESLDFYTESIYHFTKLLQVEPELVVCDLHPDYLSSQYAAKSGLPLQKVQHHHAHAVAVLVEHGIEEKALAIILDGSGLGDDNTLWGGEVLEVDCKSYKRIGSLAPMLLPGGDAAAENPWRMGLSLLHHSGFSQDTMGKNIPNDETDSHTIVWQLMEQKFNCPLTTSCGRLFDGVAALLGICQKIDYEGQAAMELESLAKDAIQEIPLTKLLKEFQFAASTLSEKGRLVLQQSEIVTRIVQQLNTGMNLAAIALDFHLCLIRSFFSLTDTLGKKTGLQTVVLSGGCMQNTIIQEGLFVLLEQAGYTVHTGVTIPVNDGGIALGQAVIGGLTHVSGSTHESP